MSTIDPLQKLIDELDVAETKAWDSLARYKFMMFGYWAGVWVHLNRVGGFKRKNPWGSLVHQARGAQKPIKLVKAAPFTIVEHLP